jgi:hypothetical protein
MGERFRSIKYHAKKTKGQIKTMASKALKKYASESNGHLPWREEDVHSTTKGWLEASALASSHEAESIS